MTASMLAMLLAAATSAAPAPAPLAPKALVAANPQPGALGVAANRQCGALPTLLACFDYLQRVYALGDARQRFALAQYLAPTASFLGRYGDAVRLDPFRHPSDEAPSDPPLPAHGFRAVDAADAIARLAHDRRLVMLNEYHMDAATRGLTLTLLPKLRKLGFRYLAVEALWEDGATFARRGYAVEGTGYYTREPVFATLLSRAVELGYTLVRYDASGNGQGREDAQARAIYAATFARDPHARVLVHAGHGHIDERVGGFGGDVQPMAMRLHALAGIDPLSIDQTALHGREPGAGTPLYRLLARTYVPHMPTVLVARDGTPWSTEPGAYDVSVLMPQKDSPERRPTWLALGGLRRPVPISADDCRGNLPCTVSARPSGQPDAAVPADRYAFLHAGRHALLYLQPGRRYRIEAVAVDGHRLSTRIVNPEASHP